MSTLKKISLKHLFIIIGCMILQAVPFGLAQNTQALFIPQLHQSFHFPVMQIGMIFTFGAIASSCISPFAGKFYNKLSTKTMMGIGLTISIIGMFCNSFSHELWQFLLSNCLVQIGCVIYSGLGVPYLVASWFSHKQKAAVLGIAFAGGSIGNFFIQPLVSNLFISHNVGQVYFICASIALIVGAIVFFTMLHDNRDVIKEDQNITHPASLCMKGIGAKKTRSLPMFWFLCIGMLLIGLNISAQSTQYANYMFSLKFTHQEIGAVGSTFALFSLIGNISGGFIFSKLGVFKGALFAGVFQTCAIITMLLMSRTPSVLLGHIWSLCYGLTVYMYMSGPAVLMQDLFGMKESSENLGLFNIFFAVGFAIGNVVFGYFVDNTGFISAWVVTLLIVITGYTIMLIAIKVLMKKNYAQIGTCEEAH